MPETEVSEKPIEIIPDGGKIVERAEQTYLQGAKRIGLLKRGILAYGTVAAIFLAGCTPPTKEDFTTPLPTPTEILTPTPTITPTPTRDPYAFSETEIQATEEAIGPAVRATDAARTEESLTKELKEFPQNIVRSSSQVIIYLEGEEYALGGSGTFIEHFPMGDLNIYLFLTAHHFLVQEDGKKIDAFSFQQPHLGVSFSTDKFAIATVPRESEADIGLIAIVTPSLLEVLGRENLQFDWVPKEDNELFSLTFPIDAPKHGLHPIKFEAMTDEVALGFHEIDGRFITNGLVKNGASGAGVVSKEGKLVGVIPAHNYVGALVQPLSEIDYLGLWNKAMEGALNIIENELVSK